MRLLSLQSMSLLPELYGLFHRVYRLKNCNIHSKAVEFSMKPLKCNNQIKPMKTLVVYDSVYGNTRKIAEKIAQTLKTQAQNIKETEPQFLGENELIIIGTPTHAFNPTPEMKNFIKKIPERSLENTKFATFDTRSDIKTINSPILTFAAKIFGYAAKPLARMLIRKGGVLITEPIGFFVMGTEGPLKENELVKAEKWAQKLNE
ncbi:hypothetical protein GF357_00800 [Candidatus Dojkabacteria bacterium]|nr:hypothetical protein [Candidatus Dojkabacteria bacterium]